MAASQAAKKKKSAKAQEKASKDAKKQAALERELPIWRAMQDLKLVDAAAPRPLKVKDLESLWKAEAKYKPPTSAKRKDAYIKHILGVLGVADNTPEIDPDSVVVTPTHELRLPHLQYLRLHLLQLRLHLILRSLHQFRKESNQW